ncbi:glycosyltransferase [Desulfopila sp. IMCC35008]|uniref:glycosyltransferase family 2 protein n=1 Tax=Desulfopila sp. IMCC35008 TaxID=2653858 RepID=UPI0013D867E0|nr:glycosyltransferase [Desulfopila sp. IMCC35008]
MDSGTETQPTVSICIPTLNGGRFLEAALESVLSQDFRDLEVIFSDDGSTDDTLDIIASFIEKRQVPARLYHHNCCGIGANWNFCVSKAQGKFIKFLMQDDLLSARCISMMVSAIERNPSVGLVYCRRKIISSGTVEGLHQWLQIFGTLHDKSEVPISEGLVHGLSILGDLFFLEPPRNKIGEPTAVLYRANVVKTVGEFREDLKQTLDYEYWYRILRHFDAYFLDEELAIFRRHESQETTLNKRDAIHSNEEFAKLLIIYLQHIFFVLAPKNKIALLKLLIYAWLPILLRRTKFLLARVI